MSDLPSVRGQNRPIGVPRRSVGNSRHKNSPSSSTFAPNSTDSTNASSVVSRLARSTGNAPIPGSNHSGPRSSRAVAIGTGTSGVCSTGSKVGSSLPARSTVVRRRLRTAPMASKALVTTVVVAGADRRSPSGSTVTTGGAAAVARLTVSWSRVIARASLVRTSAELRLLPRVAGPSMKWGAPLSAVVKLVEIATPWVWATREATHSEVAATEVASTADAVLRMVTGFGTAGAAGAGAAAGAGGAGGAAPTTCACAITLENADRTAADVRVTLAAAP